MKIASTQFTLTSNSFEIYVSGCNGNCHGCHNPELKRFDWGVEFGVDHVLEWHTKISSFNKLIKNIWVLGGEPLDQDSDSLVNMLECLNDIKGEAKIWLFTRYELDNVPDEIKGLCDYLKCGAYIEELKVDNNISYGIRLATSNQKVYKQGVDY